MNLSDDPVIYFANTTNTQHQKNKTLNLSAIHPYIKTSLFEGEKATKEKQDALKYYDAVNLASLDILTGNYTSTLNYNNYDLRAITQLKQLGKEVGLERESFKNDNDFQVAVIKRLVISMAKQHNLAPDICYGLARLESGFRQWKDVSRNEIIRSSSNALGVMQLIPGWHPDKFPNAQKYVKSNISGGMKYLYQLRFQLKKIGSYPGANSILGDWEKTLGAYNQGQGGVENSNLRSAIIHYIKGVEVGVKEYRGIKSY